LLIGLAACGSTPPQPQATPRPIDTLVPTVTATATPLPTSTPTIVPTPTPTAAPLFVIDNLRASRSVKPAAQRGAPCGVVDFFDFPLDAPNGEAAQAPWPFGYYSERYNGIHTGEDWIYDGGSLGKPVYSIGPGTVLYAQPYGWGGDLGTIIVRHTFPNGKWILSFYGHLEPESVTLPAGSCVSRGEIIGRIGNPRGRPHLHFEIRSIYLDRPGPGYWSVDPTLAGWKPPTEYIWDQRINTSPGVKWTRPLTSSNSLLAGLLISDTLAVVDRDQLLALNAHTGAVQWSRSMSDTVRQAIASADQTTIYLTTISDTLQAIDLRGDLRWQVPFTPTTRSVLIPFADGVIAYDGRNLIGLAANGNQLWRIENLPPPIDWLSVDGDLLFTVGGDQPAVYRLDRSGQVDLIASLTGQLAATADHLFVYAPAAVYRLSDIPVLLKTLDRAGYTRGSVIALPDGGVLIAHNGVHGRRLIALGPDGALRWERSIQQLTGEVPHLIAADGEVYAVTQEGDVWWIDQQWGDAQRVLDGTRLLTLPGEVRSVAISDGTLIFDARGGRLVALDPRAVIIPTGEDDRAPR
jgi:murein DD-endopeptidase MepM/ murein hydrolase activator NlpD